MKTAVVTGATGFIGKALTKRLVLDGYNVYAIVRNRERLGDTKASNIFPVVCDYQHYSELSELIPGGVNWFVHFAWDGSSGPRTKNIMAQAENIRAACTTMEQARLMKAEKYLFAGSSYQYRMEPYVVGGNERFEEKNIYGRAKFACREMLRAGAANYGIKFNSVVFTNVFGVGDVSNRSTNSLIRQLLAGNTLRLISGEHPHDWTYIDDAVNGIMSILEKGKDDTEYYVGLRQLKTFREIVTKVRDIVSPESEMLFGCYDDRAFIDYSKIDLDALYRDTGFECTADFEESIRKTAAWLKEDKGD